MVRQIVIDSDDKQSDNRIVRASYITSLYDAGLAGWLMSQLGLQGQFATFKVGAVLNFIYEQLGTTHAEEISGLDRYSLTAFIKDMQLNGYDIGFTDSLTIGERPEKPTQSQVTGGAGGFQVTLALETTLTISEMWAYVKRTTGQEAYLIVDATDNNDDTYTAQFTLPSGTYTGFFALITDDGLRGFRTDESGQFTVT